MGEVYEARHARLAGRYAVKVLHHEIRNHPEVLQRFAREAKVTSALRHPGIVQVIDFNTTSGGAPYLVMEFLAGEDLGQVIARLGRLDLERTVEITTQIASALAAAHRRGVVHRDLKPQNIFVVPAEEDDDERIKVLDFGISKIRTVSQKLTGASVVLGTPQFMAPEQAEGGEDVDAAADQFALAAIVYEALTGQPAFTGDTLAAVLYKIVHKDPTPIGRLRPDLPSRVGDALARAFSKDKADRFSSIAEFGRHLRAAAETGARRENDATVIEPRPSAISEREIVPAPSPRSGRTLAYGAEVEPVPSPEEKQENDVPSGTTAREVPAPDWRLTTFRRMTGEMLGLGGMLRTRIRRRVAAAATTAFVAFLIVAALKGGHSKTSPDGRVALDGGSGSQRVVPAVEPATGAPSPAPSIVIPIAPTGPSTASAGATAPTDPNLAPVQVESVPFELASDPPGLPVWIDGKAFPSEESQAHTWARGTLMPGAHRFELKKEGYEPWRKTVEVKPDRPNRFLARLKKEDPAEIFRRLKPARPPSASLAGKAATGKDSKQEGTSSVTQPAPSCSITIGARPWVEFWLDGTNTHLHTPVASYLVPCGPHRVGLKRADLPIDFATDVLLNPGQNLRRVFHFDAAGHVVP